MSAKVNTTFTFSSTDIASDTLSFSVSETLTLTGSGGIERIDLAAASGSGSSYTIYEEMDFPSDTPTYLYLKNITGSGFSASAGGPTTSSNVHLFMSGSGNHNGGSTGSYDIAVLKQGSFLYIPINPNTSYYVYTPTGSGNLATNTNDIGYGAGLTGTIIEYAVFK